MINLAGVTPCSSNPGPWDLDASGLDDWLQAIDACAGCPALAACAARAAEVGPKSMIWAGHAYSDKGKPLSELQLRRRAVQTRSEQPDFADDQLTLWAS